MDQINEQDKAVFSFQEIAESHKNLLQLLKNALAVIDKKEKEIKEIKSTPNDTEGIKTMDAMKVNVEKLYKDSHLKCNSSKYVELQRDIATILPMPQFPPIPHFPPTLQSPTMPQLPPFLPTLQSPPMPQLPPMSQLPPMPQLPLM